MDAMYIRVDSRYVSLAEECNFEFPIPIELQVDNKTAIAYHKSDVNRTKLKHIDATRLGRGSSGRMRPETGDSEQGTREQD